MPSLYLQPSEYATYGLPDTTTEAQVYVGSGVIDGYLNRPEGLIYANDATGAPCYMVAVKPIQSVTLVNAISPGLNVNVQVSANISPEQQGYAAILDRSNLAAVESCVVTAVISNNVIQLSNVQFHHDAGTTMEFGLGIFEEKLMPTNRPLAMLSRTPVQMILAGRGRYGYPRRSQSGMSAVNEYNLLAAITKFGGPPIWEVFDQTKVGFNQIDGQVWAPAGILLAYYTEIHFTYIAGFTVNSLPYAIKQVCANIVKSYSFQPVVGAFNKFTAGGTSIQRVGSSVLDDNSKSMLSPYMRRDFV